MPTEVKLFDDLAEAERDAAGGLDRDAQPSLFDRLEWYRLVAEHCPPPGKLLVARAAEGRRRAWLFLAVDGRRAEAWASWYSLRTGGIGEPDLFAAIARALKFGGIAELQLAPLADPVPLRDAFREAGWLTFAAPATASWRIRTDHLDFASYWKNRPSKLRSTAERKMKAAGLEVSIYNRFEEEAWTGYEEVYRASWKPEEGSPAFLRALAEREGAAGTLRLGIARRDGRPVAAQLWLVENGEATIHKLAYSEEAKALSPGTILSMAMFRHVLDEDHVRLIDYGTGDEPYKRDWMDERADLWRLTACNPSTVRGLARAARIAAAPLVRRLRSR